MKSRNNEEGTILLRIKRIMPSLSPKQSQIAQYIINNDNENMYLSITDLSNLLGVSEASIVRFCKILGYSGYQQFKLSLAQESTVSVSGIHSEITREDNLETIVRKVFNTNNKVLTETLDCLDLKELDKAIIAIEKARRIEFYGVGDSAWIAADARHKLMKLGTICIAEPDLHTQTMSASLLSKKDVAVGISHSGRTKDTIRILEIAKEHGATTICITNYSQPPIIRYADIKLLTASYETTFHSEAMASRIAQLSIIDCLYTGLAMRDSPKSLQNIEKTQQAIADKQYDESNRRKND